jgi:hypothetical protein
MLMVGLMALPAFAQGTATVNHGAPNTPIIVAIEVMGVARNLTIVPAGGDNGVVYGNAQDLFAANIVFVNLTNATFVGGTAYRMCDSAGVEIANFTTPGPVATAPFQLIAQVLLGVNNPIHITSDAACAATGNNFAFILSAGTSNALINFRTIGVGGTVIDQTGNGTLVQAVQEYSMSIRTSQHFVDVIAGNGSEFTPQTGTNLVGVLGTPPILQADSLQGSGSAAPYSIQIAIAPTNVDDGTLGLTTVAQITVTDSNNFQGVQRAFIAAVGTACDSTQVVGSPSNLAGVDNPINGSAFTIPAASFSATTPPPNVQFRMCVTANGIDFLAAPRDISATVSILMCTGIFQFGCQPPTPVTGVVQHWDLSGGDIRISGIRGDVATNNNTLININNLGPTDGQIVRLQVYRTQTITSQAAPACTIAPVPGVTIHANGGAQINAQQINALCFAQASDLNQIVYAVRMVLSYAPGNLSANAFRQFPQGPIFLELPVLKLGNAYANE